MKTFLEEFKQFAVRGNVADMAVGIIIGAAFGKIVSSLVSDIIMPPIGWIVGGVDFTALAISLPKVYEGGEAVTLNYGKFLQVTFDFLIVAFAIFMLIKALNRVSMKDEPQASAEAPKPSNEEVLLTEIRDLLKSK